MWLTVVFWLFPVVALSLRHSCGLGNCLAWWWLLFSCGFSASWFIVPHLLSIARGGETVVSTASQVFPCLVRVRVIPTSPSFEHFWIIWVISLGFMLFHECRCSHGSNVVACFGAPLLHSALCFFGRNPCLLVLEDPWPLSLFWASFCHLLQAQRIYGIHCFLEPLRTLALVCWGGFRLLLLRWVDFCTLDIVSLVLSTVRAPSFNICALLLTSLEWSSV